MKNTSTTKKSSASFELSTGVIISGRDKNHLIAALCAFPGTRGEIAEMEMEAERLLGCRRMDGGTALSLLQSNNDAWIAKCIADHKAKFSAK